MRRIKAVLFAGTAFIAALLAQSASAADQRAAACGSLALGGALCVGFRRRHLVRGELRAAEDHDEHQHADK